MIESLVHIPELSYTVTTITMIGVLHLSVIFNYILLFSLPLSHSQKASPVP